MGYIFGFISFVFWLFRFLVICNVILCERAYICTVMSLGREYLNVMVCDCFFPLSE